VNRAEWEEYIQADVPAPMIGGHEFPVPTHGTRLLCKGYDVNAVGDMRVWLTSGGNIGVQRGEGDIEFRSSWLTRDLYPTKRAYREDTDLLFAILMRERHGYPLSFTSWQTEPY
jgi:hypothetical protein